MPFRDIHDPRDPWAFRNKWTGESRTSFEELWIVIPLIVGLLVVAFLLILPLLVHKYCRWVCPCQSFWRLFDRFLRVLHDIGKRKVMSDGFSNPAFTPMTHEDSRSADRAGPNNVLPIHLRTSSVRYKKSEGRLKILRTRSCPPPPARQIPNVPPT